MLWGESVCDADQGRCLLSQTGPEHKASSSQLLSGQSDGHERMLVAPGVGGPKLEWYEKMDYLLLSRQSGGALNTVRCRPSKVVVLIRGASQKSPR